MSEVTISELNPFAGKKNIVFCEGNGPGDLKCLEQHPPEGKTMISGHLCGAGCARHGSCKAVFASPLEHPDLFQPLG